jgi:hypothetical protein
MANYLDAQAAFTELEFDQMYGLREMWKKLQILLLTIVV